jgi:hypothetical protein
MYGKAKVPPHIIEPFEGTSIAMKFLCLVNASESKPGRSSRFRFRQPLAPEVILQKRKMGRDFASHFGLASVRPESI